jgi:hypothetical protein
MQRRWCDTATAPGWAPARGGILPSPVEPRKEFVLDLLVGAENALRPGTEAPGRKVSVVPNRQTNRRQY